MNILLYYNYLTQSLLYHGQLLWTFSIYLEAVAIVPQLIVLQRYGEVENLTGFPCDCYCI
jgi:hypothetical protein